MPNRFIQRIRTFFENRLSDEGVLKRYRQVGAAFGEAVSYSYLGEPIGFTEMLDEWERWERMAASRGFQTFMIDDFINLGGYDREIARFGEKRSEGVEPIYYAAIYREKFLHQLPPGIDLAQLMSPGAKPQFGRYQLPSNKNEK